MAIKMNQDLAFLIGNYFGHLNIDRRRRLQAEMKEEEVAIAIAASIRNLTGIKPTIHPRRTQNGAIVYRINIMSKVLCDSLEYYTNSRTSIPLKVIKEAKLQKLFLKGLFYSSGSITNGSQKKSVQVRCNTPSIKIAEQAALILAEFGVFAIQNKKNGRLGEINISELHDAEEIFKLKILPQIQQQQLAKAILSRTTTKPVYHIKEYEEVRRLEKLLKRNSNKEEIIAEKTGYSIDAINKWLHYGITPWEIKKLAQIEKLSKKYNYPLQFLDFYPESVKASKRRLRKAKTRIVAKKIKRIFRPI